MLQQCYAKIQKIRNCQKVWQRKICTNGFIVFSISIHVSTTRLKLEAIRDILATRKLFNQFSKLTVDRLSFLIIVGIRKNSGKAKHQRHRCTHIHTPYRSRQRTLLRPPGGSVLPCSLQIMHWSLQIPEKISKLPGCTRGVQYVMKTAQYIPKFDIYTFHNNFH